MRFFRRVLILLTAVLSGVLFSQAPELAQQYKQRLGGSIDELTTLIQNFDEQANHNGLERQTALNVYAHSPEGFIRSQGDAMRRIFVRYEDLSDQLEELAAASPILRPLVVAQRSDSTVVANTWRDFVPAMPVSFAGAVWAVVGAVAGASVAFILGSFLIAIAASARRSRRIQSRAVTTGALR